MTAHLRLTPVEVWNGLELLLCAARLGPKRPPDQPLRLDLLIAGGSLSGPMFERPPGPLRRLFGRRRR
ncbi:MAG: hypothetical protein HKM95_11730 [Inquilinus sp.]|nr:hypothetical protein [Inquilinus sp.]